MITYIKAHYQTNTSLFLGALDDVELDTMLLKVKYMLGEYK
mgnify:CR=1 FL=1